MTGDSDNTDLFKSTGRPDVSQVAVECLNTLRLFIKPGQVTQLVALDVPGSDGSTRNNYAGFFDFENLELMAQAAAEFSGAARGVHFTLNPLKPDVLCRCSNQVQPARKGMLAREQDIVRRTWLMIDVDPRRPAGLSASDAEKLLARNTLNQVSDYLRHSGLPDPFFGDSGNGFHLYYRINLAPDDDLPHRLLQMLSARFSSDDVTIDTTVAKASQLTKLFGTISAKGQATTERPHRRSSLLQAPNVLTLDSAILRRLLPSTLPDGAETVPRAANHSVITRARRYIAKMPPSISGQHGHNRLFEAACRLVQGFALSTTEALPLLREYNARAEPPWDDADLLHKLEDALGKQDGRSRGYLLTFDTNTVSPDQLLVRGGLNDEVVQQLSGPAFPTSLPDFIPAPCEWSLPTLALTDIERRRGRQPFDYLTYVYWLVLHGAFEQKVVPIVVPEAVVAAGIGGASPPNGWQKRLSRVHPEWVLDKSNQRRFRQVNRQIKEIVAPLQAAIDRDPSGEHAALIQETYKLIAKKDYLSTRLPTVMCPSHCPLHGSGSAHDHLVLRPPAPVFGIMTKFATESKHGSFHFDFDRKQKDGVSLLSSLIRSNKVHWAYLPVQLFGQAAGMSVRQIRAVQGLMRERTRTHSQSKHFAAKPRLEIIRNSRVKAILTKGEFICPFLDPNEKYVAFGGNLKNRRGRGYRLFGTFHEDSKRQGGWLRRLGYPVSSQMEQLEEERIWKWIRIMLTDLAALSMPLGLVIGAVDKSGKWRSLDELQVMVKKASFRAWLKKCSLRIFAPVDYLVRWRKMFAERLGYAFIPGGDWLWPQGLVSASTTRPTPEAIRARMAAYRIQGKRLAEHLDWTESRVSRQLSGRTALSDDLIAAAMELMPGDLPGRIA